MSLDIGISGGHNRSQAIALSDTQVVGTAVGRSLDHHTYGLEELLERTKELLVELCKETGHDRIESLVDDTHQVTVSLPGVTNAEPFAVLSTMGWKTDDCLRVVDDTWAGLVGGTLDRTGVCAIAGTGASVFVGIGEFPFPLGKPRKLDGFGPILVP